MELLKQRDTALCRQDPNRKPSYFFNSFFMEKLLISDNKYNYKNVAQWSKKFNVFDLDKIFFPINIDNSHWTLGVIFVAKKEIHYYDSMKGNGRVYLKAMLQWLQDEARKKWKTTIQDNKWSLLSGENHVPQQMNGYDCGVFTCICADYLASNLDLEYNQEHMPFLRLKMIADISRGELLDTNDVDSASSSSNCSTSSTLNPTVATSKSNLTAVSKKSKQRNDCEYISGNLL